MAIKGWIDRALGRDVVTGAQSVPEQLYLAQMPPLTYAVGDIHGCIGPYRRLEALIAQEAQAKGVPVLIVLLGDLVDRGPDSAGVLDHLTARPPKGVQRQALMGNHEEMMLRFIEAPKANASWLDFGGRETFYSYGIQPDPDKGFKLPEKHLRYRIDAHIPGEHLEFLRALPAAVQIGPYFLCHAGIDPDKPLARQTARDLMWSRDMEAPPPDGITVVHGHTPIDRADPSGRYINVDTGAYATGRLSAVRLAPGEEPEILQVI